MPDATTGFLARLPRNTHVGVQIAARRHGVSMNQYVVRSVEAALRGDVDLHLPAAVRPAPVLAFPRELEVARSSYHCARLDEMARMVRRGERLNGLPGPELDDEAVLAWYRGRSARRESAAQVVEEVADAFEPDRQPDQR